MRTFSRKYLPLVIGVPGCLAAGWFEWTRALGGREIAWVYAFEWPLYAVVGIYMWWRIWHPVSRTEPGSAEAQQPSGTSSAQENNRGNDGAGASESAVDPQLEAWQRHLAQLQAADPPGGPPQRS
jgi:hypothetical protein